MLSKHAIATHFFFYYEKTCYLCQISPLDLRKKKRCLDYIHSSSDSITWIWVPLTEVEVVLEGNSSLCVNFVYKSLVYLKRGFDFKSKDTYSRVEKIKL